MDFFKSNKYDRYLSKSIYLCILKSIIYIYIFLSYFNYKDQFPKKNSFDLFNKRIVYPVLTFKKKYNNWSLIFSPHTHIHTTLHRNTSSTKCLKIFFNTPQTNQPIDYSIFRAYNQRSIHIIPIPRNLQLRFHEFSRVRVVRFADTQSL